MAVSAYDPFGSVADTCQPVVVTVSFTRVAVTTAADAANVPFGWSQAPVVVFCSVTFTRSTSTLSDAVPVIVTAEEPNTALARRRGHRRVRGGRVPSAPPPQLIDPDLRTVPERSLYTQEMLVAMPPLAAPFSVR